MTRASLWVFALTTREEGHVLRFGVEARGGLIEHEHPALAPKVDLDPAAPRHIHVVQYTDGADTIVFGNPFGELFPTEGMEHSFATFTW